MGHVGGGGGSGVQVLACDSIGDEDWLCVGRVAAGSSEAADDGLPALERATLQRRLIAEHACRLHPQLRAAKKRDRLHGIELGVEEVGGGVVHAVPPPAEGDATGAQMLTAGFWGDPAGKKSMYQDFEDAGGAAAYDRAAMRKELAEAVASEPVVLFAWRNCGYATKARALLAEREQPFADVPLDKFGAMHAELALWTGRPSVPCIYVDGVLAGGFDADATHPGLERALEARVK